MPVSERIGVVSTVEELLASGFSLSDVEERLEPTSVLMCDPTYFEVKDSKNPFMVGNINATDPKKANRQWHALKRTFETLGYPVRLISAQKTLEDMVFTANQVLPGRDCDNKLFVVLAEMVHPSRRREVAYFEEWFASNDYRILKLTDAPDPPRFEGQGDVIWHPQRKLLWGGHGYRTEAAAYPLLNALLGVPILTLKLINEKFYHLDTAFCALDERTALIFPAAFDEKGLQLIRHLFARVIEVSQSDADNFACNAVALGRHVVLQAGSADTCNKLKQYGFTPIEADTSEFMKSGGSVFCLKMLVY